MSEDELQQRTPQPRVIDLLSSKEATAYVGLRGDSIRYAQRKGLRYTSAYGGNYYAIADLENWPWRKGLQSTPKQREYIVERAKLKREKEAQMRVRIAEKRAFEAAHPELMLVSCPSCNHRFRP